MITNCSDIKEVWDYRLSTATPTLYSLVGENWRVELYDKATGQIVGAFDSGIPSTPEDPHNLEGMRPCYEWLLSVRDDFAYKNIEKLKPVVAEIERLRHAFLDAAEGLTVAQAGDDPAVQAAFIAYQNGPKISGGNIE